MSSPVDAASARNAGARYDGNNHTVVSQRDTRDAIRARATVNQDESVINVRTLCCFSSSCILSCAVCLRTSASPSWSARESLEFLVWIKDFPTRVKQCKSPGQPHVTCLSPWFRRTNTYAGAVRCFLYLAADRSYVLFAWPKRAKTQNWTDLRPSPLMASRRILLLSRLKVCIVRQVYWKTEGTSEPSGCVTGYYYYYWVLSAQRDGEITPSNNTKKSRTLWTWNLSAM